MRAILSFALALAALGARADDVAPKAVDAGPVKFVQIHRIFNEYFGCSDHLQGELQSLGDALGTDCQIKKLDDINGRVFARLYTGNGERNEDWYSWGRDVLSPCDCDVVRVILNDTVNQPGVVGKPPATVLVLKRADGVTLVVAHLAGLLVKQGDVVRAGSKLGVVGNNGYSRAPHIHLGALKDGHALQIIFDISTSDGDGRAKP